MNYKCSFCDEKFNRIYAMKKHEKIHTRIKIYKCKYCKKIFICKSTKLAHENIHKCKYCKKIIICKSTKLAHENVHNYLNSYYTIPSSSPL